MPQSGKKEKPKTTKIVSCELSKTTANKLDSIAESLGLRRNALIKQLIMKFLKDF
jgi:predicted transcriptional regulator